eukprot:jgi/Botrbrau1/14035/Bobra.0011s0001.1
MFVRQGSTTRLVAICFGSQILARALGGDVGRNPSGHFILRVEEISLMPRMQEEPFFWQAVSAAKDVSAAGAAPGVPATLRLLASHMDQVLRLPEGAHLLAGSPGTANEMWGYGDRVLAIQAHPELTADLILEKILPAVRKLLTEEEAKASESSLRTRQPQSSLMVRAINAFVGQAPTSSAADEASNSGLNPHSKKAGEAVGPQGSQRDEGLSPVSPPLSGTANPAPRKVHKLRVDVPSSPIMSPSRSPLPRAPVSSLEGSLSDANPKEREHPQSDAGPQRPGSGGTPGGHSEAPSSPSPSVARLGTDTPRLSPRPSPAPTLVAPVWAGSGRGTAPRDANESGLDESHFEPVATLVARLGSRQGPVPRPRPLRLCRPASDPQGMGQKSLSGPPSTCGEPRSPNGSPFANELSRSDSESGFAPGRETPKSLPLEARSSWEAQAAGPGPAVSHRPSNGSLNVRAAALHPLASSQTEAGLSGAELPDDALPQSRDKAAARSVLRDPLRGGPSPRDDKHKLVKPASMSDERWGRQQVLYQKADTMLTHLMSAVRSELSVNSADLDLLVKLNAGALEKYDKMDKSLKSWGLLGEQVKAKAQALDPLLMILDTLDAEMKYLEDIVEELDRGSRALALQVGLPDPILLDRPPARLLRNW